MQKKDFRISHTSLVSSMHREIIPVVVDFKKGMIMKYMKVIIRIQQSSFVSCLKRDYVIHKSCMGNCHVLQKIHLPVFPDDYHAPLSDKLFSFTSLLFTLTCTLFTNHPTVPLSLFYSFLILLAPLCRRSILNSYFKSQ